MKNFAKNFAAAIIFSAFSAVTAAACPVCRIQTAEGIYDRDFASNLLVMLPPVIVLAAIGFGVYKAETIYKIFRRRN